MAVITAAGVPVHQLDLETYEHIVRSGALAGQRVELIDGLITDMSPQSPEHAAIVEVLDRYLRDSGHRVRVQMPLRTATAGGLPEPDLTVIDEPLSSREHPTSALLVVEVSSTSQRVDHCRKSQMYAATGIPVYWIVDADAHTVQVRSDPAGGDYQTVGSYSVGDTIPAPLPDLDPLSADEIFPE